MLLKTAPAAEITLEANPGDLNGPAITRLLEMGVNRLSIGVQSLDDSLLSLLGRRHTAEEAIEAYRLVQSADFQNVNLDLMYGLPRQTAAQWENTLERVVQLGPPHLSLYCLTLEEGTPLQRWVAEGVLQEPESGPGPLTCTLQRKRCSRELVITTTKYPTGACPASSASITWPTGSTGLIWAWGQGPTRTSVATASGAPTLLASTSRECIAGRPRILGLWRALMETPCYALAPWAAPSQLPHLWRWRRPCFSGFGSWRALASRNSKRRFDRDPLQIYGPQIQELQEQGLLEHRDGVLRLTK